MAHKITTKLLELLVAGEYYTRVPESTMTICVLQLHSGFHVIGESACLNPEDFDEDLGRQLAHAKAFDKLWELEGYAQAKATGVTTPKQRLEVEVAELNAKLGSLNALLEKEQPSSINDEQWALLGKQALHMTRYRNIAQERLDAWQ